MENDLSLIEKFSITRCVDPTDRHDSIYDLFTFSDASKRAYAAVVYLRITNGT